MEQKQPIAFDEKFAASYDKQTDLFAPSREAMFSFMRLILADLPAQSRILCVGVGTGTEMVALAQAFPQWHFTAVDPAAAMLDICKGKAAERGIANRCEFHEGTLDTLPASEPFDAATCLLVSHFFTQASERSAFFGEIAARMRPGGILVSSDLVLGMRPQPYENLLRVWVRMLSGSGWGEEQVEKMRAAYGTSVASHSAEATEAIIEAGGFEAPTLFFQGMLIRAWFSRRAESA